MRASSLCTSIINTLLTLNSLHSAAAQTDKGCYQIDSSLTSLGEWKYQSAGYCIKQCSASNSAVFALTGGDTCLCGNSLPSTMVDSSFCSETCVGYPPDNCGGSGYAQVWLTGIGTLQGSSGSSGSSSSSAGAAAKSAVAGSSAAAQAATSTAAPQVIYITTAVQGSTITQTISGARTSATARVSGTSNALSNDATDTKQGGDGISGGAIAGIVIGVLAAALIAGLILFFVRRRRRNRLEEDPFAGQDYKRQISPASGGQMRTNPVFDTRLEPTLAVGRNSSESLADDQDYSRRKILRVVN